MNPGGQKQVVLAAFITPPFWHSDCGGGGGETEIFCYEESLIRHKKHSILFFKVLKKMNKMTHIQRST